MIKKILFAAFILAGSLISCTKSIESQLEELEKEKLAFKEKLATMKDDSLKTKAGQLGSMLFMLETIDLENQMPPSDTAYEENPYAILADYPNLSTLTNNYIGGIIAADEDNSQVKTQVNLKNPFPFPFHKTAKWDQVTLANGATVNFTETYKDDAVATQAFMENWNGEDRITVYPPKESEVIKPKEIVGSITAQIPKNVLQFKFTSDEDGDTKAQDGIKVKLVSVKGHAVQIEIDNPKKIDPAIKADDLEYYKIIAMDETQQFLGQGGSSTGNDESLKIYKKTLYKIIENPEKVNELEKEVKRLDEEFEKKYKNKVHYTAYFRGTVENIIVYVMDYSKVTTVKKELKLPVYPFYTQYLANDQTNQPIINVLTNTTAYDNLVAKSLNKKFEFAATELDSKVTISQTEHKVADDLGDFRFNYPDVFSNQFITGFERFGELKDIKFYTAKGGKLINIPKESIDFNDGHHVENPWVAFNTTEIEYHPSKFSQKASYATGTIEIKLGNIKKTSYPSNRLPNGITISGNKLLIDEAAITGKHKFYVKDKSGKYLKLITELTFGRRVGTEQYQTRAYYYYGNPQTVEVYTLTDEKEVNQKFEVNLLESKP